ncbi:putative IGR protein [Helianthus annuus]|nr:putative IGR protein [Helianthus annuus]KAJ0661814.1 putative IGR protein [Helianthus annuus]KAJ0661821.1 putative IGR protein [Helianthus annuus]KAJ0661828.1 putative IGR protein [Helianthus annuus]
MQIFRLKILLLFIMKVGIPEFLNGIGNGVETYAEKLEAEFGDLQNLLVTRSMKLKKLNVGADPKSTYFLKYRVHL